MNQEQKFDKIIRKKVDEAEFPFDEQNWNKLSMQLDAERQLANNKGWSRFLFLGLLFLGITSASIALYKIQGPLGFKDKLAANISLNDNTGSSSLAQSENGTANSNNSDNNLLALNNNSKTESIHAYGLTSGSDANNGSNSNFVINNTAASANNSTGNSDNVSKTSQNLITEAVNKNNTVSASTKKSSDNKFSGKNQNGSLKNDLQSIVNGSSVNGSSKNNHPGELVMNERTKSDLAGGVFLEHTDLNRIDAKIPIVYSNRNVKLGLLKTPAWYEEDYHRKGKKRVSFLNAEAGAAYLFGWDSKNGKDGKGLNWYAGVNYGKFLNKKLGFSVGSQFYNISNIKESFYESSRSVYGLGSTSSNTVITTQALFYFSVPVKVYYAITPTHQIGASVNPSFLFSSKNQIENYRLTDNIRSNEIKTNTSGIYEGVRLNNVLVSVFYKVKLNKRLYLNAEALYGVRDIFINTSSNNYAQKPMGLRLGVQYTLFEK